MNDHQGSWRRTRLPAALLASTLLLAACSGGLPGSSAHPVATATPAEGSASLAAREQLFAVLEPGGEPSTTDHDTVAIVGLDGVARARARFARRQRPRLSTAASWVMQVEARVVNGGVLYADGTGRVRRLGADGAVTDVASFPIGAQQALSFAADPTGTRLVAVRLTYPPDQGTPPATGPQPTLGSFTQEVLSATAGHPATTLSQTNLGPSGRSALAAVGWSEAGPLVTTDTVLAVENGVGGQRLSGHLAHLDASGRPGPAIGGTDCYAWAFLPDDTVLCSDWRTSSIRSAAGQVQLSAPAPPAHGYGYLTVSPDGTRLTAVDVNHGDQAVILGGGPRKLLPAGFRPQGWLDNGTVIGDVGSGPGDLALVRLSRPDQVIHLGFKGLFVGPVLPRLW